MSQRLKSPLTLVVTEPHRCSVDMRTRVLSRMPIFKGLDEQHMATLFEHFLHKGFEPGETIHWEGDPGENLFVLAEGKAKLTHNDGKNRGVLIDILGRGEIFGNLSLDPDIPYAHTAQALTRCCALAIKVDEFKWILDLSPQLALKTVRILAERAQIANQRFLSAGTMPVEQRVARTLVELGRKMGKQTEDYLLIDVPLARTDLAEMVGTTQESVSRVLSQMHADGIIFSGRQWVGIRDLQRLMSLAN